MNSAFQATAVVVTFDPHPQRILRPENAPRLLQSLSQRLRALSALGPDATMVVSFDTALSRVPGAEFIRSLADGFGRLRSITVGETFHFGYQRSGNIGLLRTLGAELGFVVDAVAPVQLDGGPISSTRVRNELSAGRLDEVARLLGRPYCAAGTVIHGDHLGRSLGFPTANIDVSGRALPPSGVYAAQVALEGRPHQAVLNLGVRPTVALPAPEPRLEVHLLEYSGDLYGRELEVEFIRLLRPEQKFASVEALQEQIRRDVEAAREALVGT